MRPVFYALHKSMFDRVELDIIDVPLEILLIAQCVFPISSLPNTALAFGGPAGRDIFSSG
jgi:hypothetical protein